MMSKCRDIFANASLATGTYPDHSDKSDQIEKMKNLIYRFLEQETYGAWTARDFYRAAASIYQELRNKPVVENPQNLSSAARARLGYLLDFCEIPDIHPAWNALTAPFNGPKSGFGAVGFWMFDNNKESNFIAGTDIPVDDLAHFWGLCSGAPILSLRRSLMGEIL